MPHLNFQHSLGSNVTLLKLAMAALAAAAASAKLQQQQLRSEEEWVRRRRRRRATGGVRKGRGRAVRILLRPSEASSGEPDTGRQTNGDGLCTCS